MGTSRIKIMNTALKEMRTMKKTREHLSELADRGGSIFHY